MGKFLRSRIPLVLAAFRAEVVGLTAIGLIAPRCCFYRLSCHRRDRLRRMIVTSLAVVTSTHDERRRRRGARRWGVTLLGPDNRLTLPSRGVPTGFATPTQPEENTHEETGLDVLYGPFATTLTLACLLILTPDAAAASHRKDVSPAAPSPCAATASPRPEKIAMTATPPTTTGAASTCHREFCGDGVVGAAANSDDGNNTSGAMAAIPAVTSETGGGSWRQRHQVDAGEDCDDWNNTGGDGCSADCHFEKCGDGIARLQREGCDDGNNTSGDGCSAAATRGLRGRRPRTAPRSAMTATTRAATAAAPIAISRSAATASSKRKRGVRRREQQ